ncbi:hypothetical protein PF001_g29149, partial [Phytophthora fragariae]
VTPKRADDPSSTLPMPHQGCRAHAGGHGDHCGDRLQQPDDLALQAIGLVPAGWEGPYKTTTTNANTTCKYR